MSENENKSENESENENKSENENESENESENEWKWVKMKIKGPSIVVVVSHPTDDAPNVPKGILAALAEEAHTPTSVVVVAVPATMPS